MSRGFDSYLGLLGGGADHFTKTEEACGGDGMPCSCGNLTSSTLPFRVDLFKDLAPATDLWDNHTFDAYMYSAHADALVAAHDVSKPFFLYWAPHKVHSPLQVAPEFLTPYPEDPGGVCTSTPETCSGRGYGTQGPSWRGSKPLPYAGCGCETMCYCNRRIIMGMISVVDSMLHNLTASLTSKGMFKDTIIVFLGDNGAPNNNAGSNSIFKGMKFGCASPPPLFQLALGLI